MGWAARHIERLRAGETVSFRPRGNSSRVRLSRAILHGISCRISALQVGDIVLCKVNGREYLHLIKAVEVRLPDSQQPGTNQRWYQPTQSSADSQSVRA